MLWLDIGEIDLLLKVLR